MTIAKRIEATAAKRAALLDTLNQIVDKASGDDRDFTADELKELDEGRATIATLDAELERLAALEAIQARTATPARASAPAAVATASAKAHATARPVPLAKGVAAARAVIALAAANKMRIPPWDYAKARFPDSPEVEMAVRAAVLPTGTATDPTETATPYMADGSPLVAEVWGDFLEFMRPQTVIGQLPGGVSLTFGNAGKIHLPAQSSGIVAGYVGESLSKPVSQAVFGEVLLTPKKAAAIVVVTDELIRFSTPAAEMILRNDMARAIGQVVDVQFIAGTAAAGIAPAGLRTLAPAGNIEVQSGTTLAAITADLKVLLQNVMAANTPGAGLVWIMHSRTFASLRTLLNGTGQYAFPEMSNPTPTLFNIPIIVSNNVPANLGVGTNETSITLTDAAYIVYADAGTVEFAVSNDAALQMDSAPDTPPTPLVSLFQQDMTAIRGVLRHDFGHRVPAAISVLTAVTY